MADNELVFVALGGLGEIGLNAALYGFGPPKKRQWIMVDCGLGFAGDEAPGVDLVFPDISFLEKEKRNLLGIFITHAHEDHIGALADLWPRLCAPVYGTKFALGLLETRKLSEPGAPKIPLHRVTKSQRVQLGPFSVEYVPVSHSIPESHALAIRTDKGLALHTGDWKLDDTPFVGEKTSEADFRKLGDEGILAMIGDSTNVMREGVSPSETDVANSLSDIIAASPYRVAVTTFASNVARLRAVAEAAQKCGREVVVVGRAMERVINVARECGYLEGVPDFRSVDAYGYLPREKVVALLTGSQGEPRAALARIAEDEHPDIALSSGDRVIFSSRTIPGNERAVGRIQNALVMQGIEIITGTDHLVHVSGHPRREEMRSMYAWTRPHISIPAHGEPLHLSEHAKFAREQGVPHVITGRDGAVIRLDRNNPDIIEHIPTGRIYKDGDILIVSTDRAIPERRKLSFAGIVSIAVALDGRGDMAGTPVIDMMGLPTYTRSGEPIAELVADAVTNLIDHFPRSKRRDVEAVENALERAVRSAVNQVWGKKPVCHVMVVEV